MYRIISYHSTCIYKWVYIHFLSRSVTKDPFRVGRAEYIVYTVLSFESIPDWNEQSVGDNNFIFSLLENKTGDSDLLIRSLSARMDRGRFVPELERPSNLHNEPSSSGTIINLTPRRQKSARCIKRTDIFHSCPLFYTHTIFLSSITRCTQSILPVYRMHGPLCLVFPR